MTARKKVLDLNVHPSHKGGDTLVNGGYVFEYAPLHPLANGWGFVAQHRLVGETIAGRALVRHGSPSEKECVHHKNEDKLDNRMQNLQVMTMSEHRRHHANEMNKRRDVLLNKNDVSKVLSRCKSVIQCAKELGVHHQTLRNRFPELVKPYLRSSPSDLQDAIYRDQLIEVARYFAPTTISYAELAKLTKVCQKYWKKICVNNGIVWHQSRRSMTGRRLSYRGKPTQYAKELYAKQIAPETQNPQVC